MTTHYLLRDSQLLVRPHMRSPSMLISTRVTPVIHVEISTVRPPTDLSRHRQALIDAVLDAARASTSGTVQLDMEAQPSQREFYLSLVKDIRAELPLAVRLSVMPMFFRMGRDSDQLRRIVELSPERLHPRCRAGAAGFSMQEAVHSDVAGRYTRVYRFDNLRWRSSERRDSF